MERRENRRVFPEILTKLAFGENIALMEDTTNKAESLQKIETATQNIGLFINASKTKTLHFNPSGKSRTHAMNGDKVEKLEDFPYL